MAHSISALKRARQALKRRAKNKTNKSNLKGQTKIFLNILSSKKKDEAVAAFKELSSQYDKAAKKGIVHRRNADRHKSRLAQRLAKAFAA